MKDTLITGNSPEVEEAPAVSRIVDAGSAHTTCTATGVFPFLSLPREIRDRIYELCADRSDAMQVFMRTELKILDGIVLGCQSDENDLGNTRVSTPTVLLINRQISNEAILRLNRRPFVLDASSFCPFKDLYRQALATDWTRILRRKCGTGLLDFITPQTLLNIPSTIVEFTIFDHERVAWFCHSVTVEAARLGMGVSNNLLTIIVLPGGYRYGRLFAGSKPSRYSLPDNFRSSVGFLNVVRSD